MKLGSLKEGGRDGTLIVVSRDLTRAVRATGIAPTLQRALEDWSNTAPRLNALYDQYWEEVLAMNPVQATFQGDSRYNDQLPDFGSAEFKPSQAPSGLKRRSVRAGFILKRAQLGLKTMRNGLTKVGCSCKLKPCCP